MTDLEPHYTYMTPTVADFDSAIKYLQEELEAAPNDHPDRAYRLRNLGSTYHDKYRKTEAIADLDMYMNLYKDALETTPNDYPERAWMLQSLGSAYTMRSRRAGAIEDLDRIILRLQERFEAISSDDPGRADLLERLANAYATRYERFNAATDLTTALHRCQEALEAIPNHHKHRGSILGQLGCIYSARYERTRAPEDLETAIQRFQEALDTAPDGHSDRAARLEHLGIAYHNRYRDLGNVNDLETAIQRYQDGLEATLDDLSVRANLLENLGVAYVDKSEHSQVITDLNIATQRYQEALDSTPKDHPDRARRLHNLGSGYHSRYQETGAKVDLETTIQYYQEAAEQFSSRPIDRLRPAIALVKLLAKVEKWSQAYLVASTAICLIPLITHRSLENVDKQHLLTGVVGFASDGAAVALMAGAPAYNAIEFLELGRGIISGSLSELRTDIFDLQHRFPELAENYVQLRSQLDVPNALAGHVRQDSVSTASTLRSDQRYIAGRNIEGLIQEIRKMPGFDGFLLPPSREELKANAAPGPIVVINVSAYRCDAFLIDTDEIRTLPLPRLHADDVRDRVKMLDSKAIDTQLLEWLWETIAKPVLDEIGLSEVPSDVWPRIWWIPTGPLARFPLHAAGYHSHGTDTVLDRAISSYSSSVGSLIRSRQISANSQGLRKPEKIVLVGMPELSYATREIDDLKALCDAMKLKFHEPRRLREDVLAALNDCEIFHFAGHGRTHPLDPLESALILSDGELTVSRLFEVNLHTRKPFLAYLSACGTGRVKFDTLVDESLHLIAACQLAGFQHVIGTLWEVDDRSCVDVAEATYGRMRKKNMTDESVSEGLHYACRELRGQWVQDNAVRAAAKRDLAVMQVNQGLREQSCSSPSKPIDARDVVSDDDVPLYWVPYVHFGV